MMVDDQIVMITNDSGSNYVDPDFVVAYKG